MSFHITGEAVMSWSIACLSSFFGPSSVATAFPEEAVPGADAPPPPPVSAGTLMSEICVSPDLRRCA